MKLFVTVITGSVAKGPLEFFNSAVGTKDLTADFYNAVAGLNYGAPLESQTQSYIVTDELGWFFGAANHDTDDGSAAEEEIETLMMVLEDFYLE